MTAFSPFDVSTESLNKQYPIRFDAHGSDSVIIPTCSATEIYRKLNRNPGAPWIDFDPTEIGACATGLGGDGAPLTRVQGCWGAG